MVGHLPRNDTPASQGTHAGAGKGAILAQIQCLHTIFAIAAKHAPSERIARSCYFLPQFGGVASMTESNKTLVPVIFCNDFELPGPDQEEVK